MNTTERINPERARDLKLLQWELAGIIQRQIVAARAQCPDASLEDVALDIAAQIGQALPVLGMEVSHDE